MEIVYVHIFAIVLGFFADKLLGDPIWLPHPIVAFGKSISFFTKKLNKGKFKIAKGAFLSLTLTAITFVVFVLLIYLSFQISSWLGMIIEAIFIFYGLAGTTLAKEGEAVFKALEKDLIAGRQQVSKIVGRDTNSLSEQEIKAATLETLAENLSDGVIAPLFWLLIAGVPGMMAYKMVNTLDSMIGYKNDKFIEFGRVAAKTDDLFNLIPARITALLMAIVSGKKRAFQFIFKYGKAHSSPNAGYPEAALAGALNVTFGGAHNYFGKVVVKPEIGNRKRSFTNSDLKQTLQLLKWSEIIFLLIILLMLFLQSDANYLIGI